MNIKELKTLKKKIRQLSEQLRDLRSGITDEGVNTAEISDLEDELRSFQSVWDNAIARLSYEDEEANCIYLHYVKGFSWKDLAQLSADCGIIETSNAVRKRCQRYEW